MSCSNCDNKPVVVYTPPAFYVSYCGTTPAPQDVKNYAYMGPALQCLEVFPGNNLEFILQKIDGKVCGVIGDYSTYNTACITDVTTQQSFVEKVSAFMCTLREDHDKFVGTTFVGYQKTVDTRFKKIEVPGTVNTSLEIVGTDTLQTVLTKISSEVEDIINVKLDISSVNFDQCFVVANPPDTIAEGFDLLIDQICSIKTDMGSEDALPTFNNVGSCLASPTSADTLAATVSKLKDRVCLSPTFNANSLTWGCTTKPVNIVNTDLQTAFQAVLTQVNTLKQKIPTFNGDFSVSLTNGESCQGVTVALAASSNADRYVAVNVADNTPGTLETKLEAGANISFDVLSTPGKLRINASAGSSNDQLVKSRVADPTAGYLEDKLEGSTSTQGITITKNTNTTNNKVTLGSSIDGAVLWNFLLEFLDDNPDTYTAFCQRVTECLPDCIVPPNVTVIYGSTTTTTTTTIAP